MKSKDFLLIFTVVFISLIFSIIISGKLISAPKNRQQEVEVVAPITNEFPTPSTKWFNEKSNNPTQLIKIGDKNNTKPF